MKLHAITILIVSLIICAFGYLISNPTLLGSLLLIGLFGIFSWVIVKLYKGVYRSVKNIFGNNE